MNTYNKAKEEKAGPNKMESKDLFQNIKTNYILKKIFENLK